MNTAKTPKATPTTPAQIVHFGAGTCNELQHYLQSGAKQITLVEADLTVCRLLRRKASNQPHTQVINASVAATSADATLFTYNFPGASSLHEATGLYDIFPGLKLTSETAVTTVKASELLPPLKLDSQQQNWLVIDTPGEELPILEELQNSGLLSCFSLVRVYCGTDSHYRDSADVHTILEHVQSWGYDVVEQNSQIDPDRPCWTLCLNRLFPELVSARAKLNELKQDLEAVQKTKAEHELEIKADHQKQLDDLRQQIETVKQELAEARQTASNNAKLLTLKENDLKELQQRYKQAITLQQQQHQLLTLIGKRLRLASEYFHQLDNLDSSTKESEARASIETSNIKKPAKSNNPVKGKG